MSLDPLAGLFMLTAWAAIATTTIWCFRRMLKTNKKGREDSASTPSGPSAPPPREGEPR